MSEGIDVVTLALAKKLIGDAIASLPAGFHYKGAVDYYSDLPNDAEEGDIYIVRYQGSSGTTPDGTPYVWGDYQGTPQWINCGLNYVSEVSGGNASSNP